MDYQEFLYDYFQWSGKEVSFNAETGMVRPRCMSPPAPDMKLAHRRLREGFAFVGLTEQWPLSICLFAAMFRIACVPSLFDDSRPTPVRHEARTTSAGAPSPPPAGWR